VGKKTSDTKIKERFFVWPLNLSTWGFPLGKPKSQLDDGLFGEGWGAGG
jgi:hypothetical protein